MVAAVVAAATTIGAEYVGALALGQAFTFSNAILAKAAFSAGIALVSESLQEAPQAASVSPMSTEIQARKQLVRTSAAPRRVVLGEVGRVSGNLVYVANGTDANYVHFVIVLATHRCHAINDCRLGDDLVGALDVEGNCIEGRFAGFVRIRKYLGTDDQVMDPDLAAECPEWAEKSRPGKGICYVYLRLKRNRSVFPQGIPTPRFDVEGKADVLDIRTMTTGYTRNAALLTLDWILWRRGFGSGLDEIVTDTWVAAANVADEDVALPASVGGTHKRYQINGSFTLDRGRAEVLDQMRQAMAGAVNYTMGRWFGHAGAAATPVMDLSEADLRGPYRLRPRVSDDRVYNAVKGTYTETAQWTETDFPAITNATYEAQDGGQRITKDVRLPFETDPYRAQRLAKIDLERHRQGVAVDLPLKIKGIRLQYWSVVRLSLTHPGFANKLFRVVDWKFNLFAGPDVVLEEYADAIYTWSSLEATLVDPAPDTTLPNPLDVAAPDLPALDSSANQIVRGGDGTLVSRIKVTLAPQTDPFVRWITVRYKRTDALEWQPSITVPADLPALWLAPVEDGAAYDVAVRHENRIGVLGDWTQCPPHTVIGKSAKPGTIPWATLSGDVIRWGLTDEQDLAGAVWRWQPGSSVSWGDANPLHDGLVQSPYTLANRPLGPVTLLGKLVDVVGNESETAATIITDFGDPLVANVIQTVDCHANGFTGTITDGTVDGGSGDLQADADASPAMWSNPLAAMWTGASDPMWAAATYKQMTYTDVIYVDAADAGAQLTVASTITAGSFSIDYRRAGAAPMWSDGLDPMWTDGADPMWDAEAWQTWPGSIYAEALGYEFRVSTSAGNVRGQIAALALQLDVEDINETLADVALAAGGTRLPITKTYRSIKAVNLTLQADGGSARSVEVIDKDATLGPTCRGFDSTHTGVSAHVDAFIQGY